MSTVIIPGFHPDPSVCRVGDEVFLVNSSFEYFPGVPVFASHDLTTWRQLGNALDRPDQLTVVPGAEGASGGIYAPTIRHHEGLFWLTTTNIHDVARGHLIVHSEDPRGPWSEPVYTTGVVGIDPDLAWDDDGTCFLTWSDVMTGGISQVRVDPRTGALLSDKQTLWHGTGGAHAEGPHLFRRGAWWYLLVAEGGTGPGHMVTIARATGPSGPFEANPCNPILTHRSTSAPVQSTGHADMVELADDSWAMVFLGTRPRGSFPRWHTNGRETFIATVRWVDGWPIVDEDRMPASPVHAAFVDDFAAAVLDVRWISPGLDPAQFATPTAEGLRLTGPEGASDPGLLAVRAESDAWAARVEASGDVSLEVRVDARHRAIVERRGERVHCRVVIGPLDQVLSERDGVGGTSLEIRSIQPDVARGSVRGPDVLVLGVVLDEAFEELARLDGRYLSTEVAGGFTGRVIGVSALGDLATVTSFSYRSADASG